MSAVIGPEAEAFLLARPTATLGTLFDDGSPQASVVWYLWEDGAFVVSTVSWTAKWRNLLGDPRCSICIEEPDSGRMVVAYGSAECVDGDVESATRRLVAKYYDDEREVDAHMGRIFGSHDERVLIRVRPRRVVTRRLDEPTGDVDDEDREVR